MKKLTCVLFINDPSLEKKLVEIIARFNSMEIIDVFYDRVTVIEKLNQINPDLLFIDMDDNSINGIELLGIINKPPFIIGITSRLDYIPVLLDSGFYDFLFSKDLSLEYFCTKMSKVIKLVHTLDSKNQITVLQESPHAYEQRKPHEHQKESMFVKYNKISVKVKYDDVLYIKNVGNGLKLVLHNGKNVYHNSTLKKFLLLLPEKKFIRINNSTIVNVNKIEKYHRNKITIKDEAFSVSRIYSEKLKKELQLI